MQRTSKNPKAGCDINYIFAIVRTAAHLNLYSFAINIKGYIQTGEFSLDVELIVLSISQLQSIFLLLKRRLIDVKI